MIHYINIEDKKIYLKNIHYATATTSTAKSSKANIVSMQGMYLCVDGSDKSNGGWHKGRWRVKHADLANGDAVELFESIRCMYEKPILLGASGVYVTQCV